MFPIINPWTQVVLSTAVVQLMRYYLSYKVTNTAEDGQTADPQPSADSSDQASVKSVSGACVRDLLDGMLPPEGCKGQTIVIIVQQGGILNLSDIHNNEQVRQLLDGGKEDKS